MDVREQFSARLRTVLAERDLTQADLCHHMKVSSATVSDWCNCKKLPRPEKLKQLCDLLHCSTSDLVNYQVSKSSDSILSLLEGLTKGELDSVKDYIHFLKFKQIKH